MLSYKLGTKKACISLRCRLLYFAERKRFELSIPCGIYAFQAYLLNHSSTSLYVLLSKVRQIYTQKTVFSIKVPVFLALEKIYSVCAGDFGYFIHWYPFHFRQFFTNFGQISTLIAFAAEGGRSEVRGIGFQHQML